MENALCPLKLWGSAKSRRAAAPEWHSRCSLRREPTPWARVRTNSGGKDVGGWCNHHPAQGRDSTTVTPATNHSGTDPCTPWDTLRTKKSAYAHRKYMLSPTNPTQKQGINKSPWFPQYNSAKYFSARVKKPSRLWNTSPTAFPFRYYNHKSSSLEINKSEDDNKSRSNV